MEEPGSLFAGSQQVSAPTIQNPSDRVLLSSVLAVQAASDSFVTSYGLPVREVQVASLQVSLRLVCLRSLSASWEPARLVRNL